MVGPDGTPRAHWQPFLSALKQLGMGELGRRWTEARQLIRENGVTYNVYGDPRGMERPWQLDPVPLLIGPEEAVHLDRGLVQRARLLEQVLIDLYGPQKFLQQGLVPPEFVFANPGFLRPCHGIKPSGGRFLHLYAANLARSSDGRVHVLGDRAQSPSGAGYALENRIVLSRMLPAMFQDCRVQRLALFFRALRESLRGAAPYNRDNPRIVLLTPGPFNETYFEHAYLARYLGLTLVEGGDLTVRDERVFLKVLGGLQPVDVIFRRLDDDYCDPLELRADSFLGVPGLVQAVRAGNVAVANALGSGLLESSALLAFLPALCRGVLGEDLILPTVGTWWCGNPRDREHVLANLDRLVIKPAFPSPVEPVFGDRLSAEQKQKLIEQIRARPYRYVGQEIVPLSTTPVFVGGKLQPRQMVMRAYLVAKDDSFRVMPGGLTRVSAAPDTMIVSMQKGGGSKDTWVMTTGPVSTFTMLSSDVTPVELSRGSDLPSRLADNLFWLGRYAERAEGLTRLLRGVLVRLAEQAGLDVPELPALLRTLAWHAPPERPEPGKEPKPPLKMEDDVWEIVFDDQRTGSLASVLQALVRIASITRDSISLDMWRVIRSLRSDDFSAVARPAEKNGARQALGDVLDLLDRTVLTLSAFGGLALDSMTRGQGWRFLDMGRRLERSLHTLALLRGALGQIQPGGEGPVLEAVLEVADSSMTYRRRYMGTLQTAAVLDLLLSDESNPRSLAFQLVALAEDVDRLPREADTPGRSPEQRLMLGAQTRLRLVEVNAIAEPDDDGLRPGLQTLMNALSDELMGLSDAITRGYLSHLQPSRHLAGGADA
jgi:uncharacterized circularly permuted ATP-grasp superfamily protein/uncharacterized alpha-E superfamily protein